MYQYKIPEQFSNIPNQDIISSLAPEYIKLNKNGFADLLSCSLETTNQMKWAKDKIENIKEIIWEEIKKATNPYELIYAMPYVAVADIKPLSRSFFKMIEMINEFATGLMESNMLVSLHIAEGPGGFIEATRYIRQLKGFHSNDIAFGITLINKVDKVDISSSEKVKNIPAWKQSNTFLRNHPEVIISYGADGTGNIYNPDNINHLANEIQEKYICKYNTHTHNISPTNTNTNTKIQPEKSSSNNMFAKLETATPDTIPDTTPDTTSDKNMQSADTAKKPSAMLQGYANFITADGGFDYSIDYNYQEQASSKLIYSQIITALKCQVRGGIFICKIFDMNLFITVEIIYLVYQLYEEVIIYKPKTSRIANSEKYLVCIGFKGVQPDLLDRLLAILTEWNSVNLASKTFNQLGIGLIIPMEFIDELKRINKIIVSNQICIINNIMNIYHNKFNLDAKWKKENSKKQYENAIEWCRKYGIPHS